MTSFPWAPNALFLWRLDTKTYSSSWNSGRGAELSAGRWNPKGFAVVYGSVDPSTAIIEVAVHKGFDTLDRVPHVVTCAKILDPQAVHVVDASHIPNSNWLRPGTPGHAQQQFGMNLMKQHPFIAIPSAVCNLSWNLLFNPAVASGKYALENQTDLALDTRLNRPL